MSDWLSIFTTVSVLISGFFYIWTKWKLTYWKRKGIPQLPTNLFFGNFTESAFLRVPPPILLGHLQNAIPNERFVGIYIFYKPFLLLRDPELIKQMFVKDFDVFSSRHFGIKNGRDVIGSQNIFVVENPRWRYVRQKLSSPFSSTKIRKIFDLIVEVSQPLKNYLSDQFNDDQSVKTIEVKEPMTRYTVDTISKLAFGMRTNSFDKTSSELYLQGRSVHPNNIITTFFNFCIFFFPNILRHLPAALMGSQTPYFRRIFWNSMKEREDSKIEGVDIIDNLIKLKNENQDYQGDILVAQSITFLFAGFETSSTTMAFALWELAKNPDIQERLRQEIIEESKLEGLTYDSVQRMTYLMKVINEAMRLYPAVPIIDRIAEKDYKIPGADVTIEKGTPVYVALPGIHMDPKYFPTPEKFDPERFAEDNKIIPCTFMPFGAGPRICIGIKVGIFQTAIGIISVLEKYRIKANPLRPAKATPHDTFIRITDGVYLDFEKLK